MQDVSNTRFWFEVFNWFNEANVWQVSCPLGSGIQPWQMPVLLMYQALWGDSAIREDYL